MDNQFADRQARRVFIVEDEPMIAMMLEETFKGMGYAVAAVSATRADGLAKAADIVCDVAILDLDLRGESSYDIAKVLKSRRIPLCFATGYGSGTRPPEFSHVPSVQKPFDETELLSAVEGLFDPPPS